MTLNANATFQENFFSKRFQKKEISKFPSANPLFILMLYTVSTIAVYGEKWRRKYL